MFPSDSQLLAGSFAKNRSKGTFLSPVSVSLFRSSDRAPIMLLEEKAKDGRKNGSQEQLVSKAETKWGTNGEQLLYLVIGQS
ncbi:hypothetical protein BaRGS_00038969 [Batillaria attramentaria]|uniref:Uncharacterized protein n=1 Tax=Batillaria attramentaria TaxID=370345 RepID=A0ABD0J4A9_9CAEN